MVQALLIMGLWVLLGCEKPEIQGLPAEVDTIASPKPWSANHERERERGSESESERERERDRERESAHTLS